MRWLLQSLTGRMLLAVVGIHLLLIPLLFFQILRAVEGDYQSQFLDQVRSDAIWIASHIGSLDDEAALRRFLEDLTLSGYRLHVAVADEGGRIIAQAGEQPVSMPGDFRADLFFGQGGDDVYHILATIYGGGGARQGRIYIAYDETPIKEEINAIYRRGWLLAGAYVVLAMIAVVVFGSYLTRSLRQLGEAAHRVAHGGLNERFSFASGPLEVGKLAEDLERMRAELVARGQEVADREGRMRAIVDNIADAVITFYPDGTIENCNPAARTLFDTDCAGLCGRNVRTLLRPATGLLDLESLAGAGPQEVVGLRSDGSEVPLELVLSRFHQAGQELLLAVLRDISERRRLEEERRRHRAELAHAGRLSAMGEMAAGLAHELNQPLAAINMYIQGCLQRIQRGDCQVEEVTAAMERAAAQAERAGEIIRRIRGFVRKEPFSYEVVDVNELVRQSVELVETDLSRSELALWVDGGEGLCPVKVDAVEIKQVLVNLIRNAIEAMDRLPVEQRSLVIRTRMANAGEIRVDIGDNGPGIAAEMLERIFDPFVTTRSDGMGLGLAISRSIIEGHGGRLWAENKPEGGAEFSFVLPCESGDRA